MATMDAFKLANGIATDPERIGKDESRALKSLLGDDTPDDSLIRDFFRSIWQERCAEFSWGHRKILLDDSDGLRPLSGWDDHKVKKSPYEELIHQGWEVLVKLLMEAGTNSHQSEISSPLIFKNLSSVTDQLLPLYSNNIFAAYLDGCSVVLNHSDWSSPWIAALCEDLQKSFPHAYANVYITPPGSQAVNAHADDRDVIVIQVVGAKQWRLYQKVPIPFCYTHEQVGKEGLEVPPEVLDGPILRDTTLRPGDAIYVPRGYVHEARATNDELSFHVTIALATHDWTLAGIMTKATDKILHSVLDYRKAINRSFGIRNLNDIPAEEKQGLQKQIDTAFQLLREEINVENVATNQEIKMQNHNKRASSSRRAIINKIRSATLEDSDHSTVGLEAARYVGLETTIRAATNLEKESVITDKPKGLQVREQSADAIIQILQSLKTQPTWRCKVRDLKSLLDESVPNLNLVCDLTLLSFAKICVEQGALAVVY